MNEDTPDDVVHTKLFDALFPGHSLGRETLGSHDTVIAMSRDEIAAFHGHWYRPANLVVAAAGDLDHDVVAERVGAVPRRPRGGCPPRARRRRPAPPEPLSVVHRPTEQGHVAFALAGLRSTRPAALRAGRGQPGPRRGDVEPAVPGDPRGARPGLHRVLRSAAYSDCRRAHDLRRHRARPRGRAPRRRPRRDRRAAGQRRHRRRARGGQRLPRTGPPCSAWRTAAAAWPASVPA